MKKYQAIVLFGLFIGTLFLAAGQTVSADEVTVNTVNELQDAVKNASENRNITIGEAFPSDIDATITLVESPYQIEVDGNGKTIQSTTGKQLFTYGAGTGTADSSLKLKNFNLEGLGNSARALFVAGYKGDFILDNTIVNNFRSNEDGSAFYTAGNTTITNSTFSNNVNNASGYSGGAIASKGYNSNFEVRNSKFIANQTLQVGTGNVGGEGGAIYFFQPGSAAKFIFKNNYFEGNKAVENATGGGTKLADGGAIALFNTVVGTDIQFDGNSFVRNIAGDDGGAVLIQTNAAIKNAAMFKNNTFYQNKALGKDFSANSGGAIQTYANGSPLEGRRAVVDYVNNTFVENEAAYDGGAIGSSGYLTNLSAGRYANNLFAGNKARNDSKKNVADATVDGAGNIETNLGYDNGTASSVTMQDAFGTAPVGLVDNYNNIKAGTASDSIVLPTVPIAPEKLADDQVTNLREVNEDQRGFPRTATADIGSIEIDWIKYDSNGGIFDFGTPLSNYDGTVYYEETQPTTYYQVGYKDLNQTIPAGVDLKATRDGYEFAGWSKDKAAKEPDADLTVGQSITIPKGNETLYAVWEKSEPVIVHYMTYDENKNLVQISPDETLTGSLGTSYHAQIKQIDAYVFAGVKDGDSITGFFSDEAKEITLIYTKVTKEKGTVLTQYQDEAGKPLLGDEVSVGEVGSEYSTVQKDVSGYKLKEIIGSATGKYTNGITKVIYVYTKNPAEQGKVIVHYQTEDGTPLTTDVELKGSVDDYYSVEVKPFDDYVLKGIVGNASGRYLTQDQEVTLIYAKKGDGEAKGVLVVEYQDEAGHPIQNSEVTIDEIGKEYQTSKKEITGYTFKEVKGNEAGKYSEGITKVSYIYKKDAEPVVNSKVTIHYQDEQGKKLADDFIGDQPAGSIIPLNLLNKEIENYVIKEVQGVTTGLYTIQDQEITVIYRKKLGQVVVNYISDSGEKLADSIILNGAIGSEYHTKRKEFAGYVLKEPLEDKTGIYAAEPQTITYIYSNKGIINVRYADEAGNELSPTEQKIGKIGDKYETTGKEISGWKIKETPKNAKGEYQAKEQTITYVYIKEEKQAGGTNLAADSGAGTGGKQADEVKAYPEAKNYSAAETVSKNNPESSGKILPKTGEETTNATILMFLGIAVIGMAGVIIGKRRKFD
ncbi:MucBP domain-containing protein [Enterococcus sp.]|uniref:MucBP domain-containing protein n=1 Tax=Enterococcus sp. TaxID=35783 RepID=UPI00291353C5|nr:MucBP domain-containing protein [Enterococcus sp.]MDU5333732.1 MucBP domain-containing protein [Enterococcus sp.]